MLLTENQKRALRRVQADKLMNKRQLAEHLGLSHKTVEYLTKDNEPQNVQKATYEKISAFLAENI